MSKYVTWALMSLAFSPANAFFLMPCWPVSTQRVDPIVNPYAVSPHVHQIAGGSGFNPAMNYSDTQAASCTTCFVKGDKSNYWIPAMYAKHADGTFERVPQVGSASMYYFNEPSRLGPGEKFEAFPKGLRMLAGDPYNRAQGTGAAFDALNYKCLDYSGVPSDSKGFPTKNCPNGVRAEVTFPSCWDGKNLDSSDHKSHMAYPTGNFENGACPSTHPHHLVTLKVEFIFDTSKYAALWTGGQQPFVWSSGDSTGFGLHADYFMGWDFDLLKSAVDSCFDQFGVLDNCAAFKGQIQSAYVNPGTCKVDSFVNEDVGGIVKAMPGCNSVTSGGAPVVKALCNEQVKLMGKWANGKSDSLVDVILGGGSSSASSATTTLMTSTTPSAGKEDTQPLPTSKSSSPVGQENVASGPGSSSSLAPVVTSIPPQSGGQTIRYPVTVTITDLVTEIVYTTATVVGASSTPTTTAGWRPYRREIGDDVHKHHYRHFKNLHRRHVLSQEE